MRKIFLSFTSTLWLMARGVITKEDFEGALFYFGCAREHALGADPEELEWIFGKGRMMEGFQALRQLQNALRTAERDGRATWRPLSGDRSLQQLSELLEKNNARPLNPNFPPFESDVKILAIGIAVANTVAGTQLLDPVY